jgi:hypothetical protein
MYRILFAVVTAVVFSLPVVAEANVANQSLKANVVLNSASGASVASPVCCPKRCISYKHHRPCKKVCCTCAPPIQTVLLVKDPCVCGCFVEVPICLPVCCEGEPKVCCKNGLLGRSIVEYEWCCGYRVKIVFDRRGDLVVHTFGS